ncbi:MAG: hypothetical protein JNM72_23340 [Deltaproteobacteria bacterium]|nr:hypothetical protein [Deltaproteobacteria bacterium]
MAILLRLWLLSCMFPSTGCRVGSSTGKTAFADTGDANPDTRPIDWSELSIDDEGLGALVEVKFNAAYGIYGYEGWGGPHTVRDEFFYGAGFPHPIAVLEYTGEEACTSGAVEVPDPTMDLGRELPFTVGNRELTARRTRWGDGEVDYMWEPAPLREARLAVGATFSLFGEAGPTVPEAVQLTEAWDWDARKAAFVTDGRLRIGWEPSPQTDDYLTISFTTTITDPANDTDIRSRYHCTFEDDGGVVLTASPAVLGASQFGEYISLSRERATVSAVAEVGDVALFAYATTWLEGDSDSRTSMTGVQSSPPQRRPAPHRLGAPTRTLE